MLPFGILEKHGPHLPIGTDLLDVRYAVINAVKQEYAVVFPQYYFGQIFEAQQQPGTIAYSLATQLTLLQETVKEMARNGCKKSGDRERARRQRFPAAAVRAVATGHAARLRGVRVRPAARERAGPAGHEERSEERYARRRNGDVGHAGGAARPGAHGSRAGASRAPTSTASNLPDNVYTGIWWYARFPNHYSGEGSAATKELGEFDQKAWSKQIAEAIKAIKADSESLRLQNEFFEKSQHPLDTKQ